MLASSLQGCVENIGVWLRKNVLLVAAAALGIAFVEVRNAVGWGDPDHLGSRRGWPGKNGPWTGLGKLALPPLHPRSHLSL